MNRSPSRVSIWLCAALALRLAILDAQAHDPFDCSSRLTVQRDRIEIVVTMGLDGARQLLSAGGFSPPAVAETVRTRGPHAALDLPATLAPRFFEVNCDGKTLAAESVTGLSEGMEVLFTLNYPRPPAGTLELRAAYYDGIEDLRRGSFVACDEGMKQLGAALLSRASVNVRMPLPAIQLATTPAADAPPPVAKAAPAAPPPPTRPWFRDFFNLGVEHILTGFDHLLFLAALLIGVRKPISMLGIITCFTLAHSMTLALAALNLVTISSRIIEPLIAVSIIVVCIENLRHNDATAGRFWLAGGFGLIHGFGFAGALRETGLGQAGVSLVMPLFSFNLGVETGQLIVMAVFLPALLLMRRWQGFARYGTPAVSTAVILISGYWLLERTVLLR